MTIVAEDMEIAAHRVVLAACSPYFLAMFTGTCFFFFLLSLAVELSQPILKGISIMAISSGRYYALCKYAQCI